MSKNIYLILILLSLKAFASDWVIEESIDYESNLIYNNYGLASSDSTDCYLVRTAENDQKLTHQIYHTTDAGYSWNLQSSFIRIDVMNMAKEDFIFSSKPNNLIMPFKLGPITGKPKSITSNKGILIGISNDTAKSFQFKEFKIKDKKEDPNYVILETLYLQVFDENNQCMLLYSPESEKYRILYTKDNWSSNDTSYINFKGIISSVNYINEDNIIISLTNPSKDKPQVLRILNFNINNKQYEQIYAINGIFFDFITFINDSTGFAYSFSEKDSYSMIYKTNSGGRSWDIVYNNYDTKFNVDNNQSISRFYFYDDMNGVFPYNGGLLMTNDGGNSWEKSEINGTDTDIISVCNWVGKSLFAEGSDNKIYRYIGDSFDIPLGLTKTMKPENGELLNASSVKLEWAYTGMATHYRLEVSKEEFVGKIDNEQLSENTLFLQKDSLTSNNFIFENLDSGLTYYWRVQPYNSKETGNWSEVYNFTVDNPNSIIETFNKFSISPNPAEEYIAISFSNHSSSNGACPIVNRGEVEIYDMLGNMLLDSSTPSLLRNATPQEGNFMIDVSHLPKGVYFVRIGERVEKFVKK